MKTTLSDIFQFQDKLNSIDGSSDSLEDFAAKAILNGHKRNEIVEFLGESYRQCREICEKKFEAGRIIAYDSLIEKKYNGGTILRYFQNKDYFIFVIDPDEHDFGSTVYWALDSDILNSLF